MTGATLTRCVFSHEFKGQICPTCGGWEQYSWPARDPEPRPIDEDAVNSFVSAVGPLRKAGTARFDTFNNLTGPEFRLYPQADGTTIVQMSRELSLHMFGRILQIGAQGFWGD